MSTTGQSSSWNRLLVGIGLGLILAFLAFGIYIYFYQGDKETINPELFGDLQDADLSNTYQANQEEKVWPGWRGPQRDGIAREKGFLTNWPENGLKVLTLWEKNVGASYSSMVVADNRVYTMMQDGDNEAVVCWEAETGKELWRFRYPAHYENQHGDGPRSTPTIDGNRIYTVGATGIMHCLETHSKTPEGEVIWKKDLLQEFQAENLRWGVSFSPLVVDDLVYTNPGGTGGNSLVALDKYTGDVVWKNLDDQAGYSSPIVAELAGRKQIVFFTAEGGVGVHPRTGEVFWRFPCITCHDCNIATPIAAGDYVFFSSGYGTGCCVIKIEEGTGGTLAADFVYKNKRMQNHFPSCVLYEDHLYGFNDDILTCMEFRTGNVKWRSRAFTEKGGLIVAEANYGPLHLLASGLSAQNLAQTGGSLTSLAPFLSALPVMDSDGFCMNGHLIVLSGGGILAIAKASPEGFDPISTLRVSQEYRCWVSPVLANGLLYVRDKNRLVCLDLRK